MNRHSSPRLKRRALLIATSTYSDEKLSALQSPLSDIDALSRVLSDPSLGDFTVEVQHNESERNVKRAIYRFLSEATRSDLSLLYFSCHGIRDADGSLYFATTDTELSYLRLTAISSDFIKDEMEHSRSRRTVLLLDCCYAGAFARGVRARSEATSLALDDRFGGRGTVVISAASSVQQSFEDVDPGATRPSFFTEALVDGIESGEADLNGDGFVDVDEAFSYVEGKLHETSPSQQPSKRSWDVQGKIILSAAPTTFRLPLHVERSLRSLVQYEVLSGVQYLENYLYSDDPRIVDAAASALRPLTSSRSRVIREAARLALDRQTGARQTALREARVQEDLLKLVLYRVDCRVFRDGNRDGFGDYRGIIGVLDYLVFLGISGIVLHPPVNIGPSRRRVDRVTPRIVDVEQRSVGSFEDFSSLIEEAHQRGIAVIAEYVIDQTERSHRWFEAAAASDDLGEGLYIWSEYPTRRATDEPVTAERQLIFSDNSSGDWSYEPRRQQFYWHAGDSTRPALDMSQAQTIRAVIAELSNWLESGVDGIWLSTPHELAGPGTAASANAYNLLRAIRQEFRNHQHARFLMADTPRETTDAYAYMADQNAGLNCSVHENLATALFLALSRGDVTRLAETLRSPRLPDGSQWCIALNAGNGLSLLNLTDEDVDQLKSSFGRDPRSYYGGFLMQRLADVADGNQSLGLLFFGLLLSLPGVPLIYYGDEIGMGANLGLPEFLGLHTPMQWAGERGAGFSMANPGSFFVPVSQDLRFGQQVVNMELQLNSQASLLYRVRHLIEVRTRDLALTNGTYQELDSGNRKILAFARIAGEHVVITIANFGPTFESASVDLKQWRGRQVQELTTGSALAPTGAERYGFLQAPYAVTWLDLRRAQDLESQIPGG